MKFAESQSGAIYGAVGANVPAFVGHDFFVADARRENHFIDGFPRRTGKTPFVGRVLIAPSVADDDFDFVFAPAQKVGYVVFIIKDGLVIVSKRQSQNVRIRFFPVHKQREKSERGDGCVGAGNKRAVYIKLFSKIRRSPSAEQGLFLFGTRYPNGVFAEIFIGFHIYSDLFEFSSLIFCGDTPNFALNERLKECMQEYPSSADISVMFLSVPSNRFFAALSRVSYR